MLKKTISYTDYDGNKRVEDCYFNLSKAELSEMELSIDGGLASMLKRIVAADDRRRLSRFLRTSFLNHTVRKARMGRGLLSQKRCPQHFHRRKRTPSCLWNCLRMQMRQPRLSMASSLRIWQRKRHPCRHYPRPNSKKDWR